MQTATHKRNVLNTALALLRGIAQDDQWITVHPNGPDATGRPALIDESGTIKAGMGGKFNGRSIDDVPRGKNPHPVTEEKWQARQKRVTEKQAGSGNSGGKSYPHSVEQIKKMGRYQLQSMENKYGGGENSPYLEEVRARGLHTIKERNYVANIAARPDELRTPEERQIIDAVWKAQTRSIPIPADIEEKIRANALLPQESGWKQRIQMAQQTQPQSQPAPQQPTQPAQPSQATAASSTPAQSSNTGSTQYAPRPVAPPRPEGVPDGYWNGKVYSGNRVYIDGRERRLSPEKIEALQKWQADYQKYKQAREADTQTAPKQYLNVRYEDREKVKKAGARWDPSAKKWYWDKRDGEMPQKLGDFGTIDSRTVMDFDLAEDANNPENYEEMRGISGRLALDRNSVRTKDENGYLHVKSSHISKATVNPYYGREIPGWKEEGLEPDKIYYGLRDPEELKKSVPTWAGLPLHIEHHIDSAEDPQKLTRVGTVGTEIVWNDPYLDAPLTIWDQHAIDGIEDDSFRELSCAYRYEPDFTPGTWNGKHYDFVMRNIRGNHVALVEEGRAGSDVLVADAKPDALRKRDIIDMALDILRKAAEDLKNKEGQVPKPANTNSLKKEGFMSKFRKWFGAQDSEPAPKEEKADLVQAILDLHRRDPKTGELREDVQEDADKVAELKVLVEGLRGKLPPEDLEHLIDAVGALAEAEEVGDEDPLQKKEEDVENVHADAMRKAGCDAEDPDEARAFAGGVAYGEELERNPEERAKLDREHESEGMQKAMDRCGVDSENPAETRAFVEGVKYGEEAERAKAEAKDADPEGGENVEPVKKDEKPAEDEDKDAMIKKILAAVPDLTEEQKKKIQDTLSYPAYAPATGDEDLEKKVEGAADRALKKRRFLGAVDAARIRAQATKDAMDRMRQITEACHIVRPLVGEMDALGFDSANDVYGYTLEQLGKEPMRYDRKAWRGMVAMLLDGQAAMARDSKPAINSKPIPDSGPFRYLKNITISG